MAEKLTKARREMLEELRDKGSQTYAPFWPPVKWALSKGLIEQFKIGLSDPYRLTPAGRAALEPRDER
jgi:hypothetical protein